MVVTNGPVGLMKSTRKKKLFTIIDFFLEFFPPTDFDLWKCIKKVLVGGVVGFLNIVSNPGPDFVKVKARFSKLGD